MVKKITESEFKDVTSNGIAVVDFSATWCGPCQMLAPVLDEVSEELVGKINFFKVDVDECNSLAAAYGITNIPALLVLKDGEKQEISVGFKPKEVLLEELQKYV
ncbi:MAG: thioredoxin [Agathobacter sp.]|nr:thioredoxin [Agathobacter sp.]